MEMMDQRRVLMVCTDYVTRGERNRVEQVLKMEKVLPTGMEFRRKVYMVNLGGKFHSSIAEYRF
jgi:hypothetical protein